MHFNIQFFHACSDILQIFHKIDDKHTLILTIFLNKHPQIIAFKLSELPVGLFLSVQ